MLLLALRELVSRRTASVVAALGLLVATLGFVVLASTAKTAEATLRGDIGRAWSSPYDLLVRPRGSETPLEAGKGLVRPNFLAGINGGITLAQLDAIRGVPGVDAAAPLAVSGNVLWPAELDIDLSPLAPAGGLSVFRFTATELADAGLSSHPPTVHYAIVKSTGSAVQPVPCPNIGLGNVVGQGEQGGDVVCYGAAPPSAPPPGPGCGCSC